MTAAEAIKMPVVAVAMTRASVDFFECRQPRRGLGRPARPMMGAAVWLCLAAGAHCATQLPPAARRQPCAAPQI